LRRSSSPRSLGEYPPRLFLQQPRIYAGFLSPRRGLSIFLRLECFFSGGRRLKSPPGYGLPQGRPPAELTLPLQSLVPPLLVKLPGADSSPILCEQPVFWTSENRLDVDAELQHFLNFSMVYSFCTSTRYGHFFFLFARVPMHTSPLFSSLRLHRTPYPSLDTSNRISPPSSFILLRVFLLDSYCSFLERSTFTTVSSWLPNKLL